MKYNLLYSLFITIIQIASIAFSHAQYSPDFKQTHIVYSDKYDISFFGIEKYLHHFDSHKYSKVFNHLKNKALLQDSTCHEAKPATDQDLLCIHTQDYLNSLKNSKVIAHTVGVPLLAYMPNFLLQTKLLKPMRHATGGTILAAKLAMKHGVAINLSGGYHHAKANISEGFCFFADIPLAVNKLWQENPDLKVLIVDLDAHQGNGVSTIFGDDKRICIVDAFGKYNYPRVHDGAATQHVQYPIELEWYTDDTQYLELIKQPLKAAIETHKPDLIIYNAGTDILEGDQLGCMSVTKAGVIQRDEMVIKSAIDNKIPVMMVLSGGYTQQSADVIACSVENIMKRQV